MKVEVLLPEDKRRTSLRCGKKKKKKKAPFLPDSFAISSLFRLKRGDGHRGYYRTYSSMPNAQLLLVAVPIQGVPTHGPWLIPRLHSSPWHNRKFLQTGECSVLGSVRTL